MRNAGLVEHVAARDESVARIERHRRDLRVEDHARFAAATGFVDETRHERAAHAASAPGCEHGDAADMSVRQEARAADRIAGSVDGERVQRLHIGAVPLEHLGHALLDDEYAATHLAQLRRRVRPTARMNGIDALAVHRSCESRSSVRAPATTISQRPPTGSVTLSGTWPNGNPV